ncbi:putative C6 transcription factor [Metarhizium anisopliae]|nr:putative C6 transcription factor [Metarhizium anisopliae]
MAGSQPSSGTPTSFPNAVAPERASGSTVSLTSAPTSGLKNADAMTGLVGDHTANVEYFGSSSAISFMRQINTAIDTLLGRPQVAAHSGSGVAQFSQTSIEAVPIDGGVVDPMTCTLPSRAFADGLMQDYYRLVWVILPIHDWLVFEKGYRAIWLGEPLPLPEKELYYMFNLAFALGSQFSDKVSPGKRNELGQTFWKRAQALYDPRLQPTATLGGVQCLLMMGLFLQGTSESHQCWMAIGSAVRMAQSLGLHMASTVSNESFRELEISRRVWHGCVSMDRILSMTFGRPSMIANWMSVAVPLPRMIDDDYLDTQTTSSSTRPDGEATKVSFFIESTTLYEIVNDSLLEIYMNPENKSTEDDVKLLTVVHHDSRLSKWLSSIPENLLYSVSSSAEDFILQRQRIVLRARYLHARILLLRPIVAEYHLKQPKPSRAQLLGFEDRALSQGIVDECLTLCFGAAHETIDMIYTHLDRETVTGPTPAWWFSVLFVYQAATVLLAQRFGPSEPRAFVSSLGDPGATWDKAMQLLKAYSQVGESARRCIAALEILSAKFQHHTSQNPAQYASTWIGETNSNTTQESRGQYGVLGDLGGDLDLSGVNLNDIQLNVDDMVWLNTSAGDVLF